MSKSISGSPRPARSSTKHPARKTAPKAPTRATATATATASATRAGRKATKATTGTSGARSAAAARPTRFRSRHPVLTALVPVGLVVAALVTMVVVKAARTSGSTGAASSHLAAGGSSATADPGTTTLSPAVVAALAVPAATLDTVGSPSSVALPTKVGNGTGTIGRGADGKPLITYIGAEYCPYCAAERWALAVALSRFGTFTNLSGTHSSTTDIYPNTQTLSFYGSTYASPFVDFQAVEEASNQRVGDSYATLQTPTSGQSALLTKEDPQGSIPFLDIANRYVVTGSSFSPQVLQGLSRSQIATQLADPSSAVAQAVDGAANAITAAITSVTGKEPSDVANSAAVAAIAQKLGA